MADPNLTLRQQKWFASVRGGLERETGKPLAEWVTIARACPETKQRARLAWLKAEHGLLQNRAMLVLDEAFGHEIGWDTPAALSDALWCDPKSRAVLDAIDEAASAQPSVMRTVRKGFTAWSRKVQFAAARPLKNGGVVLGLALLPSHSERLAAPRSEPWSERLRSRLALASAAEVDASLVSLLATAWSAS